MSRVYTDTIEPRKPTQDITLGTTGETITLPGNDLRVNTVKDKGGNTLWTSDGSGNLSSVNSGLKGNLVLLNTTNATNQASVSFTSGIDSTYDVYIFKFIDINVSAYCNFQFNGSSDSGSNYNVTKTTTWFRAEHYESDSSSTLAYAPGNDLAQSTAYQMIFQGADNDADDACAGELHLFTPSSTTYVKNFYCTGNYKAQSGTGLSTNLFMAGYFNTTSVIDAINFAPSTGTFDGTIKMYGLL